MVTVNYSSDVLDNKLIDNLMDENTKRALLEKAKTWFIDVIAVKHVQNTEKLVNSKAFNINPFLVSYLANYLTGDNSAESIARALIYPRVLGTSITTSFGTNMQSFTSDVLEGYGSAVPGIDIEFIDQVDQRKKYCQAKLGPNTINEDDVESIHNHFDAARRLAITNQLNIGYGDLIVAVLYGERNQLSGHYRRLENQYAHPVFIGQTFWHRLTGDADFYLDLIQSIASAATEVDGSEIIEDTVQALAKTDLIQQIARR